VKDKPSEPDREDGRIDEPADKHRRYGEMPLMTIDGDDEPTLVHQNSPRPAADDDIDP